MGANGGWQTHRSSTQIKDAMNRYLEEFKKFNIIEKLNLLIISLLMAREIYLLLTVEYSKYEGNPTEQIACVKLSILLFILNAGCLFIPYYFQIKSPGMQWLKDSDDPKANLFVSKLVTSGVLTIVSIMLIYNFFK